MNSLAIADLAAAYRERRTTPLELVQALLARIAATGARGIWISLVPPELALQQAHILGASDPDSGANGADDNMIDVLEDNGDDPVVREITGFINAMTEDEQIDLVALMRLGRGDGTIEEWEDLRREAAEGRNSRTASYLLGEPLVSDYLAEGLDAFGLTWADERTTPVR